MMVRRSSVGSRAGRVLHRCCMVEWGIVVYRSGRVLHRQCIVRCRRVSVLWGIVQCRIGIVV